MIPDAVTSQTEQIMTERLRRAEQARNRPPRPPRMRLWLAGRLRKTADRLDAPFRVRRVAGC